MIEQDTIKLLRECDAGIKMGVKSLSGYLNNYKAADEKSKNIAKELICLEERLSVDMRGYLSAK